MARPLLSLSSCVAADRLSVRTHPRYASQLPQRSLQSLHERRERLSEAHLGIAPPRVAQHEVEQQMPEGLPTYGHPKPRTVGEVHLRLTSRRMILLEVHLPVRPVKCPVVADPALKRPQMGTAEPAGVSLVEPLEDSCRTQFTLGIGPKQWLYIPLPHVNEGVRPRPPAPSVPPSL